MPIKPHATVAKAIPPFSSPRAGGHGVPTLRLFVMNDCCMGRARQKVDKSTWLPMTRKAPSAGRWRSIAVRRANGRYVGLVRTLGFNATGAFGCSRSRPGSASIALRCIAATTVTAALWGTTGLTEWHDLDRLGLWARTRARCVPCAARREPACAHTLVSLFLLPHAARASSRLHPDARADREMNLR